MMDSTQARDVARWRKEERARLIAARMALSADARKSNALAISGQLGELVPANPATIVSVYWPFRGEPDLRPWMAEMCAAGAAVALPVVEDKGRPLVFRLWRPGARLVRGVWNIPCPAEGAAVVPNVVVAPVVGFDRKNYRLGYGGGYYDRTLAAFESPPCVIGVAHPLLAIETIYPQPHDIAMDWIVTGESGPVRRV